MPLYCETSLYGHDHFPIEPLNAITSLFPVIVGAISLYFLLRRKEGGWKALLLAFLLIFTGLGSTAWHATREEIALIIDTVPGLAYFAAFILFWVYHLGGRWLGVFPLGIIACLIYFLWPISPELLFIGLGIFVVLLAGTLILITWRSRRSSFIFCCITVGLASLALVLRSIDLSLCEFIPFGTHFFWHIFLAMAAYYGIRLIVKLQNK